MLKIILNEFLINGYYKLGEDDGLVYLRHQDYDDYWVVCFKNFDLATQSELYEQYLGEFAASYPMIRKNTSLIIIAEEGRKTSEEIVAIENDPFLFKKYYLSFSPSELKGLTALLTQQDGELIPVEDLMVRPDIFARLKDEIKVGTYHLLYAVAHKLPILPVSVDHENIERIDLQLNREQQKCLEWCMGLSESVFERRSEIEQSFIEEV